MMSGVIKWAAALCVVAVGCTALQMLAPKKGMGNIFRLITAAFFLCCMATPLLSLKSILPLEIKGVPGEVSADLIKERVQEQFNNQVNAALKMTAEQALRNYKITPAKIEAKMDTGQDGSIYINDIVLYLDKQNKAQAITAKQVLEERLGIEVTVMILE